MGTKAIFKIYDGGKFILGSWLKYDGGVDAVSAFQYVMKNTEIKQHFNLKYQYYKTINEFVSQVKYRTIFGDKKKPFINQINEDGQNAVDVLFWDKNLSEKKLMKEFIWGDYVYELHFTKTALKIKVSYGMDTKQFKLTNPETHYEDVSNLCDDVVDWVYDIDYGLNDCDCKDEKQF